MMAACAGGDKEAGQIRQEGTAVSASGAAARHADASAAAAVTGPQAQLGAAASGADAAGGATENRQLGPSRNKQSRQSRVDEHSQTEYAVIPPQAKKRSRDLLTEHQREVAHRQRQGRLLATCSYECSSARSG